MVFEQLIDEQDEEFEREHKKAVEKVVYRARHCLD
jgi:hypothetical protein